MRPFCEHLLASYKFAACRTRFPPHPTRPVRAPICNRELVDLVRGRRFAKALHRLEGAASNFGYYLAGRPSNWRTRHLWKSITDKHHPAGGKSAIAEAFGTYEMLVIVGKDDLAAASGNAASSQALFIVARVVGNAALAPGAPAEKMMPTATKAEISHARWPLLESS